MALRLNHAGLHASLFLGFSLVWVSLGGKAQGNLRSINLNERNPEQKSTGLKHLELVGFPPLDTVRTCLLATFLVNPDRSSSR